MRMRAEVWPGTTLTDQNVKNAGTSYGNAPRKNVQQRSKWACVAGRHEGSRFLLKKKEKSQHPRSLGQQNVLWTDERLNQLERTSSRTARKGGPESL